MRLEELIDDKQLLKKVVLWATVELAARRGVAVGVLGRVRHHGRSARAGALLVTFGLANVIAVIPITPGGLGIVDAVYIPMLVGFGLTRAQRRARRRRRTG